MSDIQRNMHDWDMKRIITRNTRRLGQKAWKDIRRTSLHTLTALLFMMFLAAGMGIVAFKSLTHDLNDMVGTVSMAGKLRLLSQKIELDIVQFAANSTGTPGAVLSGISEFDTVIDVLTHGGTVFGIQVERVPEQRQAALEEVRSHWHEYRSEVVLALQSETDATVFGAEHTLNALRHELSVRATRLLHASENLVDSIVKDMQQRQRSAAAHMYNSFAVVIIGFLLALWFVQRRIGRPISLLHQGIRRMSGGDHHLHLHYAVADDMGQLIHEFNNSVQQCGSLLHDLEQSNDSLKQSEMMFRGAADHAHMGIYMRAGRRFLYVNQAMAGIFGYEREVLLDEVSPTDVFVPDEAGKPEAGTAGLIRDTAGQGMLRSGYHRDGTVIDLRVFEWFMSMGDETIKVGIVMDVTRQQQDEALVRLARLVFDVSNEAMVIATPDSCVVHVNPRFTEITGYEAAEVVGRKMNLLSSSHHDPSFHQAMWGSVEQTGRWAGEAWNRRKCGEIFAKRLSVNTLYSENGDPQYRVALFTDITQRKKTDALIWKQANFDWLTNLPNRKLLLEKLELALLFAENQGINLAVAFLDIDHFKDINDTLGHEGGDTLLKLVAVRIQGCLREGDTVGRLGGDEFMVIIGSVDNISTAENVCRRIRAELAKPFVICDSVVNVTVSMGVALFPRDGEGIADLFKNADMAMYEAKARGRNKYCWFKSSMQEKIALRQRLAHELAMALEFDQFELVYQPIIDLATGNICKAEALIRWDHPERGRIGPAEFIPVAEDLGIIDVIGDWVFKTAVQQVAQWRASYEADFQVSINVSPVQFLSDESGLSRWFTKLDKWQLDGSSLVVEITEGLLMDASGTVTRHLHTFQKGGVQVALDDFGTGYSSLAYLKKFDIDYVKIDRTFVSNLGPGTDDQALCEAIVVMAHRLGLKVVAEGVETAQQHRLLVEAGCDYGQGFLFGTAVGADAFALLLQQQRVAAGS